MEKMLSNLKPNQDEQIWLEKAYEILESGNSYNDLEIYSVNYDKFSNGFMPEDLNTSLVRTDGITLLGIRVINPDSKYLTYCDLIISALGNLIQQDLKKEKYLLAELKERVDIPEAELSKTIRLIFNGLNGFLRSFGSTQDGQVRDFGVNISLHGIRKFKSFISVEKELEVIFEHEYLSSKRKGRIRGKKYQDIPMQKTNQDETVKGSVFILMQIDPKNPDLEDILNAIKDVCQKFSLEAVRADEIEHQDKITDVILNKIKTSEIIIADLTGERPNVYYEIGYAHSEGKRPILVRKKGTKLHFDLSIHNAPEYENVSDLKRKLTKTLEHKLGRSPN